MMRILLALALALSVCRGAAAQPAPSAISVDDGEWRSEEHPVDVRRSRLEASRRRPSWTGDRLALLGHVGIGAPAGALGVDVDVAPVSFFALDLGAGISPNGWQFAATPRIRFRVSSTSFFTLGSGLSFGAYDNEHSTAGVACVFSCIMDGMGDSSGWIAAQHFERALWHNVELGVDLYAREGRGVLRLMAGYGYLLNDTAYSCAEDPREYYATNNGCGRTAGHGLLFAAFAGGFNL